MEKKHLYDFIPPVWLLWIFPPVFLVFIAFSFAIDSMVMLIGSRILHISNVFNKYKRTIFKIWIFGFLADIVGVAFLFCISELFYFLGTNYQALAYLNVQIRWNIDYNPFGNGFALLITILSILIAMILIYYLNQKFTFKNAEISKKQSKILSMLLAFLTAPYLLLIPLHSL